MEKWAESPEGWASSTTKQSILYNHEFAMHDQCTEKCLVQAGQKEIILLSRDIPIRATSFVTAAQENLQVEAEESYYLL